MSSLVEWVESHYCKSDFVVPEIGSTVEVHLKIVEGKKERKQIYKGLVVSKSGKGIAESFSIYRVADGYASQKSFPLHSPSLLKVVTVALGDVRRAKLNYILGKMGKKARVKSKVVKHRNA